MSGLPTEKAGCSLPILPTRRRQLYVGCGFVRFHFYCLSSSCFMSLALLFFAAEPLAGQGFCAAALCR